MREDFPLLKEVVYLDNAATSQMPKHLAEELGELYKRKANVARGIYKLAEERTLEVEETREKVAKHIEAESSEIIFTKNSTEGSNLIMRSLFEEVKRGDKIVVSVLEHHSNFLPWWYLAQKRGAKLEVVGLEEGNLAMGELERKAKGAKIVACTAASNVLGIEPPVEEICKIAREEGAVSIIDCAQYAPFRKFSVKKWGCDFAFFSAHKMCGPFGVGVVYGARERLEKGTPFLYGSGMVVNISKEAEWAEVPSKFESGTPAIQEIIIFKKCLEYLERIGWEKIEESCRALGEYTHKRVSEVAEVVSIPSHITTFNVEGVHPHDVAAILDSEKVCVRSGHHCALPIHQYLGVDSTVRASVYFYNSKEDIDKLAEGIEKVKKIFKAF